MCAHIVGIECKKNCKIILNDEEMKGKVGEVGVQNVR